MSDYKPITGELRKVMNHTELRNVPLVELGEYEFARRCDEIDAIHAQLERENAELKAKLDLVRGKQEEHAHASGESITDELREWYKDRIFMANGWQEINDIADRIDVEHERLMQEQPFTIDMVPMTDENMAEHGWVRKDKEHIISHATIEVTPHIDWSRMADELNEFVEIVRGIAGGAE